MKTRLLKLTTGLFLFLTINAPAAVRYVNVNNASPSSPYTSWATAATNIQNAIDVAAAGDQILVTNGVYQTGGRVVKGEALTNRVAVTQVVIVQSVNGPSVTVIAGNPAIGDSAVRCVYLTNNSTLMGFTLTNGATRSAGSDEQNGGGVWGEDTSAMVSNCVMVANAANNTGGGAYNGTLNNCLLLANSAPYGGGAGSNTLNYCTLSNNSAGLNGGGVYSGTLNDCTLVGNSACAGGGAASSTLNNCTLSSNSVTVNASGGAAIGGGATDSTLNNCTLIGNSAARNGGGVNSCTLNNCLLVNNSAHIYNGGGGGGGGANFFSTLVNCTLVSNSAEDYGGGAYNNTVLHNCIDYDNTAPNYPNYNPSDSDFPCSLDYCCSMPLPDGSGNFTNAPLFVDEAGGNFRLQSNSPCINAGDNDYVTITNDLDGNPRIVSGTVDLGAYEFQGLDPFHLWLQSYGLPTDGSADYIDSDGTGMNNWQKWIAGLNPTNPASVLKMLPPVITASGVTITWQSVTNRTYFLQRSSDLTANPAFATIATNIAGQPGTTSYTDTNVVGYQMLFYRVGVGVCSAPTNPPSPPTMTWNYDTNAGTLTIMWNGTGFHLQAQTNAPGVGLTTNWFDYSGETTSPVTIPIDPKNGVVFFRLVWP